MRTCYPSRMAPTPLAPVELVDDLPPVWCKLEFLNPSGSIKDRIAAFMIGKALRCGQLHEDGMVVEASSGSTSIAMALVCAQLGLRFKAIMPEGVSRERILMIQAYGAEIELTDPTAGIGACLARAEELAQEPGVFLPRQFANADNAETHRRWTASEAIGQIPGGAIDAVVSGVGTGGTIVGLYQGVADHGCPVTAIAARPVGGQAVSEIECCSFSARIPGVVDGLSQIYRPDAFEHLIELDVADDEAIRITRALHRLGFPVGPSSGLNVAAAIQAQREHGFKNVVTVFPDRMERYFSTELFKS